MKIIKIFCIMVFSSGCVFAGGEKRIFQDSLGSAVVEFTRSMDQANLFTIEMYGSVQRAMVFYHVEQGLVVNMISKDKAEFCKVKLLKKEYPEILKMFQLESLVSFSECYGKDLQISHQARYVINFKGKISYFDDSCLYEIEDKIQLNNLQLVLSSIR